LSIENRVRINLAVCIDSIGYVATYGRLAQKLGLELGEVHEEMNKLLDVRKRHLRKHRKLKKTRATRKRKYYEKLRQQSSKMVQENRKNLLYGPGITGVFAEDRPSEPAASLPAATMTEETAMIIGGTNSRKGPDGKVEWRGQQCLLWEHRQISSSACFKNKKDWVKDRVLKEESMRTSEISAKVRRRCVSGCQLLIRVGLSYDKKNMVLTSVYFVYKLATEFWERELLNCLCPS
jgi:hypothetical protein